MIGAVYHRPVYDSFTFGILLIATASQCSFNVIKHNNFTEQAEENWSALWKNRICSTTSETEKVTRKASDAAENLQLYRIVRFFRPRSLCTTTHL